MRKTNKIIGRIHSTKLGNYPSRSWEGGVKITFRPSKWTAFSTCGKYNYSFTVKDHWWENP